MTAAFATTLAKPAPAPALETPVTPSRSSAPAGEGTLAHDGASEASALEDLFLEVRRTSDPWLREELCTRMRPKLYRVAYSVLRAPSEADDVAQEAMVRALTKSALFVGRGSAVGWMQRIARNLAKNRLRDRSRRREIRGDATDGELDRSRASGPLDPEQALFASRLRARLEEALATLPRRQREVLELRLFGELAFSDIAAVLKISEPNARVSSSNGLKRLRSLLEDLQQAPHARGAS